MIAITAKIPVKPGSEADFEKAMLAMAEQVHANEPGNKMYTLCKGEDGVYVMMELYDDAAAVEAHRSSDHYKAGGAASARSSVVRRRSASWK